MVQFQPTRRASLGIDPIESVVSPGGLLATASRAAKSRATKSRATKSRATSHGALYPLAITIP